MTSAVTAQLLLIRGNAQHFQRVIQLSNTNVSIGRAENCNVVWGASQISLQHAYLEYVNSKWFIRDTSTNGISVNGNDLVKGELSPLNDLDIISFLPTSTIPVRYRFKYASSSIRSPMPPPKRNNEDSSESDILPSDHKKKKIIVSSSEDESSKDDPRNAEFPNTTSTFKFKQIPGSTLTTDEQVNKCNDIETLKAQLKSYIHKAGKAEAQLEVFKRDSNIEREAFQEAESSNAVFKEETYKKILELMETELSCSVCNEIFIQATVIECGHTFCDFCIAEWSRTKQECPICRKRFTSRCRHTEVENFITNMFGSFNEEIASNRQASILDRENQVQRAEEEAAPAQTAHQNQVTRVGRIVHGIYVAYGLSRYPFLPN